jgi:hypothetical protein
MAQTTPAPPSAVARPGRKAWALIAAWLIGTALAMWWLNPIGVPDLLEICRTSL